MIRTVFIKTWIGSSATRWNSEFKFYEVKIDAGKAMASTIPKFCMSMAGIHHQTIGGWWHYFTNMTSSGVAHQVQYRSAHSFSHQISIDLGHFPIPVPSGVIKRGWLRNPSVHGDFITGKSPKKNVYFPASYVWLPEGINSINHHISHRFHRFPIDFL